MISHERAPGGWLPRWTLPSLLLLGLTAVSPALVCGQAQPSHRTFRAEGSDLLMGVGPGAMAMGGAVVAGTGDVYSAYWNPAGLLDADPFQLSVERQLNAELIDVAFAGLAFNPSRLRLGGLRGAVALAWMTRLHVQAEGHFGPDDLETVFLRFALPALPNEFDGRITSKTRDYRLSVALAPASEPRWSVGATVGRVDCRTDFCGVTADDPGVYKVASTDATAVEVNLGAKLFLSDGLTLGANLKDLNTHLDVEVAITDADGTTTERFVSRFPRALTVGLLWKRNHDLDLEVDVERTSGKYGTSELDFRVIRAGLEKRRGALAARLGVLVPLKMESEATGDVRDEMPLRFGVTLGGGWQRGPLVVDLAVYAHPVMSYGRDRLYPAANLSVGYRYSRGSGAPNP